MYVEFIFPELWFVTLSESLGTIHSARRPNHKASVLPLTTRARTNSFRMSCSRIVLPILAAMDSKLVRVLIPRKEISSLRMVSSIRLLLDSGSTAR